MEYSDPKVRAWIVLGLFVGLRPTEAERIDWSSVRLTGDSPCVVVDGSASKIRQRRIIPILPSATAWLALDAKASGPIVTSRATLRRFRRFACENADVEWHQDIARHTFATMRIAAGGVTVNQVADEMGNSVRMIHNHYREIVPKDVALEFWTITPLTCTHKMR